MRRIPVLLPMSGENALAAEKTAVTLHSAPASFQFNAGGDVRRPLKRELSALKSAVSEPGKMEIFFPFLLFLLTQRFIGYTLKILMNRLN